MEKERAYTVGAGRKIARYRRNVEGLREQIRECLAAGFEPRLQTRDRLFALERHLFKMDGRSDA